MDSPDPHESKDIAEPAPAPIIQKGSLKFVFLFVLVWVDSVLVWVVVYSFGAFDFCVCV